MARPARLLYELNDTTEVVSTSEDGIPIGWMLCFGGRNYWNPDDAVGGRGGAAEELAKFQTPLEVADARLTNALGSLSEIEHLWVWYAALDLLRRRIQAKGKKGYLLLDASWAMKLKGGQKLSTLTAYPENMVHLVDSGDIEKLPPLLQPLEGVCTFVPRLEKTDQTRFKKLKAYKSLSGAEKAAAAMVGWPEKDPVSFQRAVEKHYRPEFDKLGSLSPYPEVKSADAEIDRTQTGLFGRIKSLLRRD